MTIRLSYDLPPKVEVFALFESTGWNDDYRINANEFMTIIKQSWYWVSAFNNEELVGFGRVVSDGILHAVIIDVIVSPEYQNQGIGRIIMNDLIGKCKAHKIRDIQLFCARGKAGFYEKCGFAKRPDDGPGMEIKTSYKS
jgi:ribosomal protein S18 acetylase RimI-like enzyme